MSLKSYLSPQAYRQLQTDKAKRLISRFSPRPYEGDDVAEFIQREMVIPETGKPLILHPEQADVLHAMSHKTNGNYDYSTWLYSAPKKSGKTTIGASVALWQALQVPNGAIYIIGNDQKQSDNRMMEAIRYAINHNPRLVSHARIVRYTIYLDNGTKIESIPVDPKGEAGMNPTGLFWTEAWGAMGNRPEMLWSEAALSPSRAGKAFKFIESYAGFIGESLILERLYNSIIKSGKAHDIIPELFTNQNTIGYWCTRHYMPWQVEHPEYYASEEAQLVPSEFQRIHRNQWADAVAAFLPIEWWTACKAVYTLEKDEPLIIGVDAATTSDCFAIVAVSRRDEHIYVHYCKIWTPPKGGAIDYGEPEAELRRLINQYNVIEIAFDSHQLISMMQRIRNEEFVNTRVFSQNNDRLIADKRLYDMIRGKAVHHQGEPELIEHIGNAAAEIDKHDSKLRIVKRQTDKKIDACVALSMCTDRCFAYAF